MIKKSLFLELLLTFLMVIGFQGMGWAYPSVTMTGAGQDTTRGDVRFSYSGGERMMSLFQGQITSASGDVSAPVVGSYQFIYIPERASGYDYILVAELEPGIWSLSKDLATIRLTQKNQLNQTSPDKYLEGYATAQTIDFNKGIVTWGDVTNLQTFNVGSSATLKEFSQYSTGTLAMSFVTDESLRAWVSSPGRNETRAYSTTLSGGTFTGAPEPAEWALLLIGLAMIGHAFYRRRGERSVSIRPHLIDA